MKDPLQSRSENNPSAPRTDCGEAHLTFPRVLSGFSWVVIHIHQRSPSESTTCEPVGHRLDVRSDGA